ncbi:carboxypeptidase regulatory-like domain-containing protein [Telmatobacter bradus]|uniref:carboxypeptidase regulatory-like domain-containing protein n=1 Tax=Telmatobacter bradus TaxID=474953 RepID=UPI003B42D783
MKTAFTLLWMLFLAALPFAQAQRPTYKSPNFTIGGTVVNALNGDPVRAAHCTLTLQANGSQIATTESDENGHFAFSVATAAKYQLRASHAGYTASFYEQHGDFSSAIVAGPEQHSEDLTFRLPPMAMLRGTITGEGGDAVEDAIVLLYRVNTDRLSPERLQHTATATTDDLGSYTFDDLEPGEYRVAVKAQPWYAMHQPTPRPGFNAALDVAYPVTYYDATNNEPDAQPIRLEPGSREQANVALHAVPALRLSVENSQGSHATLTQTIFGHPAPTPYPGRTNDETADETGFYGIASGHYQLTTSDPERLIELDATTSGPVDPQNGVPAASVSGKVETAPGVALSDLALLTMEPAQNGSGNHPLSVVVQDGAFSLDNVPAGVWSVHLRNGYGYEVPLTGLTQTGTPRPGLQFVLRGSNVDLLVRAKPSSLKLAGFVRRGTQGVPGAMVLLVPAGLKGFPGLARRDQSDSDGSFELQGVLPGSYTVIALENAWNLDWTDAETIRRFLPAGTSVTLTDSQRDTVRLTSPVQPQTKE